MVSAHHRAVADDNASLRPAGIELILVGLMVLYPAVNALEQAAALALIEPSHHPLQRGIGAYRTIATVVACE